MSQDAVPMALTQLGEEEQMFRDSVRRFAAEQIGPLVRGMDESQQMDAGLAANGSTPSQKASRREQAVLLADALSRLPEDYREVIILRHLEALSFQEVARQMQRSEDSVQKLWVRALASLRRTLGDGE